MLARPDSESVQLAGLLLRALERQDWHAVELAAKALHNACLGPRSCLWLLSPTHASSLRNELGQALDDLDIVDSSVGREDGAARDAAASVVSALFDVLGMWEPLA